VPLHALADRPRHVLGGYQDHAVPAPLALAAEGVWCHASPPAGGMHRVLPDPSVNLVFRCTRSADGRAESPRLSVIGPQRRPVMFRFEAGQEIAGVRVKLEWSRYLLGLDPADHADAEHEVEAADIRLSPSLLDTLALSRTAREAAGILADALGARGREVSHCLLAAGSVGSALDLVRAAGGRVRVELVAHRLGVSLRQLRRVVRNEASLSLKAYARMTRLNAAMARADAALKPAWCRISADAGYCDQSHLVRECRALTGFAPGPLHRERRAQADLSKTKRA
jgi:AraC-like DNA-binding protein